MHRTSLFCGEPSLNYTYLSMLCRAAPLGRSRPPLLVVCLDTAGSVVRIHQRRAEPMARRAWSEVRFWSAFGPPDDTKQCKTPRNDEWVKHMV